MLQRIPHIIQYFLNISSRRVNCHISTPSIQYHMILRVMAFVKRQSLSSKNLTKSQICGAFTDALSASPLPRLTSCQCPTVRKHS